jgi:GT2 family glycosyltransferase
MVTDFPAVTFVHSKKRLLPHAARNLGAQKTSSELLVFTDPDIYAPQDWLEQLVDAYRQYGGVIIGALTNHTDSWLDWGIHLGKFDSFLPEAEVRSIDFCATANMLCSRRDYEKVGGFESDEMLGDLLISWKFAENNIPMYLAPKAVAAHHHTQSLSGFMHERYIRGMDFGRLRQDRFQWTKLQTLRHILFTVSGLRLLSLLIREARNSLKAGLSTKFLYTFPVSLLGQISWLAGEITAFFHTLIQ